MSKLGIRTGVLVISISTKFVNKKTVFRKSILITLNNRLCMLRLSFKTHENIINYFYIHKSIGMLYESIHTYHK